jgi:hypothetical protein
MERCGKSFSVRRRSCYDALPAIARILTEILFLPLETENFQVQTIGDVHGVSLCGALKSEYFMS